MPSALASVVGSALAGGLAVGTAWWWSRRRAAPTTDAFLDVIRDALSGAKPWPAFADWPPAFHALYEPVRSFEAHHLAIERALETSLAESRELERLAVESGRRLRDVLDRVTDGFVAVDREWRYAYVNPTAGRLLGKAPEALVGQRIWADFPEAVGRPIDQALRRAFETQEPVVIESQFFPHDRWFLNHVYPSPDGLSIFFDETTEKRRTAQEMEETRLRLELAIEASRIGIWDWDLAAHTIWIRFSSARRRLEPVTTFAGPASAWLDRIHPEDVVKITAARDHHIAERTPSFELEFRTREVDDSWHWTFVSAAAVRDEDDRPTRLLGMHMDITDRKRMEQALIDSREQLRELARSLERAREAERTRVAQEIHDELGQALAVIGMDVAWLEKNHQAPVEARLERTGATRALLADTVKVVRRIATELRPGVLDDLGLAAAIDWQGKEFASRSGIRVTTEVAEVASLEPDAATTVFRLLQESLTNVARHAQALSVHIGLAVEGDELVLTVTDDGIGIRTEPRTGSLGLVGMRERTHSWGGSLAVERAPGRGTRVRASLPVARVLRKAAP